MIKPLSAEELLDVRNRVRAMTDQDCTAAVAFWVHRCERLLATLQSVCESEVASRAETAEAQRLESAASERLERLALYHADLRAETVVRAAEIRTLRNRAVAAEDLAADLVEGLEEAVAIANAEGLAAVRWKALLTRAAALGVGKQGRAPHICPRCGTLYRGDDRHACAEKDGKKEKG